MSNPDEYRWNNHLGNVKAEPQQYHAPFKLELSPPVRDHRRWCPQCGQLFQSAHGLGSHRNSRPCRQRVGLAAKRAAGLAPLMFWRYAKLLMHAEIPVEIDRTLLPVCWWYQPQDCFVAIDDADGRMQFEQLEHSLRVSSAWGPDGAVRVACYPAPLDVICRWLAECADDASIMQRFAHLDHATFSAMLDGTPSDPERARELEAITVPTPFSRWVDHEQLPLAPLESPTPTP